jgi:ABC-type transporter lipoprotein component MlaA
MGVDKVNETSLTIGEYEDLKKAALDPYIAPREAYHQYRQRNQPLMWSMISELLFSAKSSQHYARRRHHGCAEQSV